MSEETVNAGADTVVETTATPAPTTAESVLSSASVETPVTTTAEPQTEGEKLLAGKYKSAEELEKAYKNLETKIGSKGITVPGDDATDEERAAYYKAIGKPETADAYEIAVPEGMQADAGLMTWYKETAHKYNMTKSQAESFAKDYNEFFEKQSTEQWNAQIEQTREALKAEYGVKLDQNLGNAKSALYSLVDKAEAKRLGDTYGNDPGFIKALVAVYNRTSEDKVTDKSVSNTGIDPTKEYNSILKDKGHKLNAAYWNGNDPLHNDAVIEVRRLSGLIHQG